MMRAAAGLGDAQMDKVDFKTLLKPLYSPPSNRFVVVDVPEMQFLIVDGAGDPNLVPAYQQAVEWLFSVSYGLKFMSKSEGKDFVVMPLEGLWWADDMSSFISRDKSQWSWTMMIMQPNWIAPAMADKAIGNAAGKLGKPPVGLRLERFHEGRCVQIMHKGSYDEEGPTLARLHGEFLPANGLVETGHHHEIYIGDPRKTAPARLKTILRQPVRAA